MPAVIDVSGLPAPTVIDASYDPIKAARLASLKARFVAAGIPWDVDALETDPGVVLQEEDAYRESLDRTAINDAVLRVLPAFAALADLDQLVALNNTARLTITPADTVNNRPAVTESDAALLRRFLAGFSMPAAGSEPAYIARALAAYPAARDIAVFKTVIDGGPRVNVVILAATGAPSSDDLSAVYVALHAKDAAPLTAAINVVPATINPWSIRARLTIPQGPDPAAVVALAKARLLMLDDARFRIGGQVPSNAPAGALYVPNVIAVELLDPFNGVPAAPDAAPQLDLSALDLQTVIAG